MSTTINVTEALGEDFVKLSGPDNSKQWIKALTEVAKLNGIADVYDGIEPILDKPTRPTPPTQVETLSPEDKRTCSASRPPDNTVAASLIIYSTQLTIYNSEMTEWKGNRKTVLAALALLQGSVESWIWKDLPKEATINPHVTWTEIKYQNKATDIVVLQRTMETLDTIQLTNPAAIRPFLAQVEDLYNDIKDANGTLIRSQLIYKVNKALPHQYKPFVHHWKLTHLSHDAVSEDTWRSYRTILFYFADEHRDEWNTIV